MPLTLTSSSASSTRRSAPDHPRPVGGQRGRRRTQAQNADSPAATPPGFSSAMSLPLAGRSARGSEGIGSGRGGIAGVGEPVDRRPRPHIGGPVASPSRRRPSPRRPMPPHAREQYSPVRPAGWVPSRASWPTCRFPVAHGRKRPHWRDSGRRESELVIELRSCEEEAGVAVDDAGPVRWALASASRRGTEPSPSSRCVAAATSSRAEQDRGLLAAAGGDGALD